MRELIIGAVLGLLLGALILFGYRNNQVLRLQENNAALHKQHMEDKAWMASQIMGWTGGKASEEFIKLSAARGYDLRVYQPVNPDTSKKPSP